MQLFSRFGRNSICHASLRGPHGQIDFGCELRPEGSPFRKAVALTTGTPLPRPGADLLLSFRAFGIFASLGDESLGVLAAACTRRTWPAGVILFQRGDAEDHLLAITKGRVRLSLARENGQELVLRHLGPGDVLGEMALIDGLPRSADAVTVETTSVLLLDRSRFHAIAAERPDVSMAVAKYLCGLLRNTNYQMESIALYDLKSRIVRFILLTLQQLYGDAIPAKPVVRLGLNQSDLSSALGASRPKINQALQALIGDGVLRRDGSALACNVATLRELAQTDYKSV